uniref:Uncharacterized protein n=1 Tax=Ursus americanus TaxID=9643 RepID=A0A452RGG2_URSAM
MEPPEGPPPPPPPSKAPPPPAATTPTPAAGHLVLFRAEHQRGELLLPLRLGGQMPQRLHRHSRAGPLPAGPAARRLRPEHLQRGASARLLPPLPGLRHGQGLRQQRRRATARRRPVPRSAPRARLRPATRARLRLSGCSPERASPRFTAAPYADLRWRRRGLTGRRGGARVVLGRRGALPSPFREQQSLAREGLPGQFQRRKRSQLAHCKERQEEALPLHQAPDAGAGEGVSVQHVPYSRAAPRDQPQRPPHGQTSQNLVSESQDETEENEPRKPDPGAHSQF